MTGFLPINKLTIRPMRVNDVEQVFAIDQASFTLPWPKSAYLYELNDNPNSILWVAEVSEPPGRRVVGIIVVWLILDEAHIATIAVHPDYRRQGIGQRLLFTALEDSIRHGSRQATLEVRAQNFSAQQMYHRFGFKEVGRRPRYYRDNFEDAIIMTVDGLGDSFLQRLESSVSRETGDGRQANGSPA